jgi:hypothetical protein
VLFRSGCGSYGHLADFKAEIVNTFVARHEVSSVVEFGCGDGNQLSLMHFPRYLGLDVAPGAVELCRRRFAGDATKSFTVLGRCVPSQQNHSAEMALSLDVVFHLVEDSVYFSYMKRLFDSATKYVIIYSDDCDEWDNSSPHVRHRKFTKWVAENRPEWQLIEHVPNRFPFCGDPSISSFADFWIYSRLR